MITAAGTNTVYKYTHLINVFIKFKYTCGTKTAADVYPNKEITRII